MKSANFAGTVCKVSVSHLAGAWLALVGASGALANELWSLRPLNDQAPPNTAPHPIDAFIESAVEGTGGNWAPPATRQALARRAAYDLTGLPPDVDLLETFVGDSRSDDAAVGDLVEALLASPHYGERWGRHWLDVVRYADTAGENSDHPIEDAWRYRNWVIDAFNQDKPYDKFVEEQLAGDILSKTHTDPRARASSIIATGYLSIARRFGHEISKRMYLTYEDAIDNFGKAFLGLSIACARCHDHKHDPIPATDYYALYGIFASTRLPYPGCEPTQQPRDLVPITSGHALEHRRQWEAKRDELRAQAKSSEEKQVDHRNHLKELAASCYRVLSAGDVPDAGAVNVTETVPLKVSVQTGEALQLAILPQGNYGADTTVVSFTIEHQGAADASQRWSLLDLLDHLPSGNPNTGNTEGNGQWAFLDLSSAGPRLLHEQQLSLEGHETLQSWTIGGAPSVFVNRAETPVKVWTTLPPRTFFVHPGPNGPVAVTWISPINGEVTIHLEISDGHPGGDGVGWRLEHFDDPQMAQAYHALGASNHTQRALADHAQHEPEVALAYAVAEGAPADARLHQRGDPEDLGDAVPRHYLTMLGGGALGSKESSGRLELARRLTDPNNPLTARVMINRIWQWHFGRGLVTTPNDFGNHGTPPTHPRLLDFLARKFIESGWSVKAMHRLIMSSETYRRAALPHAEAQHYRGFASRRLSAEELRDTLLVAAGTLDRTPGQGHPFPDRATWGFTQHGPFAEDYPTLKRSVYVMRKRNRATPFFALFDGPDPNASTAERGVTTVPTQALYFMNDPFFHESAGHFAKRVQEIDGEPEEQVDFACRLLYARPAEHTDVDAFKQFASEWRRHHGDGGLWDTYARILLASNELLFLD